MPNDFNRSDRVASQLQRELAVLIRDEIRDPRVHQVSISEVEVSRDLSHAKVYVLISEGQDLNEVLTGLEKASGFLRNRLGQMLKLRMVPQLRFYHDDSVERGGHIDQLLKNLSQPAVKIDGDLDEQ